MSVLTGNPLVGEGDGGGVVDTVVVVVVVVTVRVVDELGAVIDEELDCVVDDVGTEVVGGRVVDG
jgi:hypothetical protein